MVFTDRTDKTESKRLSFLDCFHLSCTNNLKYKNIFTLQKSKSDKQQIERMQLSIVELMIRDVAGNRFSSC